MPMGPLCSGRPTLAHIVSFRASPRARSRDPLGVTHVRSYTVREPLQRRLARVPLTRQRYASRASRVHTRACAFLLTPRLFQCGACSRAAHLRSPTLTRCAPALACSCVPRSCAPTGQRRSAPHTASTSTCCRTELRLPCSRAARAHQCAARACLRGAAAAARRPRAPRTACCRLGRPPPEPERTLAQAPRTTSADQRLPSPAPERAQAARSPLGAAAACRTPAPSFTLGPSRAAPPGAASHCSCCRLLLRFPLPAALARLGCTSPPTQRAGRAPAVT
jgi:hypothetical protein